MEGLGKANGVKWKRFGNQEERSLRDTILQAFAPGEDSDVTEDKAEGEVETHHDAGKTKSHICGPQQVSGSRNRCISRPLGIAEFPYAG